MILQGHITQSGEPIGYASIFYSDKNGVVVDNGERTESDLDGYYQIDLSRYESSSRFGGYSYDGYLTFSSLGEKKTYSISDLSCSYNETNRLCTKNIEIDGNILDEITAIYMPTFWDKYKYYIISISLIIALYLSYKFIKK